MPGEIILNDNTCFLCKPGFYSYVNPMLIEKKYQKCSICVSNAVCLGGNQLYPLSNYYKVFENSTYMTPCLSDGICTGYKANVSGYCELGNIGVLCSYCDYNYDKSGKGYCSNCLNLEISLTVKLICFIFTII